MTRTEKLGIAKNVIMELSSDEAVSLLMEIRPYITVEQMGKMLGIGRNQAYALANREDFYPAKKISAKRIVVNQRLLDQWMMDGRTSNIQT